MAVSGVALGIGALLWATGDDRPGDPVVRPVASQAAPAPALDEPAVPEPVAEEPLAPVEPVAEEPVEPVAEATAAPALELPVLVLNNSRIEGLAQRTAARLVDGGWPVRDTGSLRGRIRATTVYYAPGQEAAARELAERFPFVRRVLPRLAELPGEGLTLVVTRDAA